MGRNSFLGPPKNPSTSASEKKIEFDMKKEVQDKKESDTKRTRVNFFDEVLHVPFTEIATTTGITGNWARAQQMDELKQRAYLTETSVYLHGKRTSEVERIMNQHHKSIKILEDTVKKQSIQINDLMDALKTFTITTASEKDPDRVPAIAEEEIKKEIVISEAEGNTGAKSAAPEKAFDVAKKASYKVSDKKTLKSLRKAQLQELCVDNGIEYVPQDTKDKLILKLTASTKNELQGS